MKIECGRPFAHAHRFLVYSRISNRNRLVHESLFGKWHSKNPDIHQKLVLINGFLVGKHLLQKSIELFFFILFSVHFGRKDSLKTQNSNKNIQSFCFFIHSFSLHSVSLFFFNSNFNTTKSLSNTVLSSTIFFLGKQIQSHLVNRQS